MANQKLIFTEGQKVIMYGDYFADQDMDSCDIAPEIAESVVSKEFALPTELYIDTSITDNFGCDYEWYKIEWAILTDENEQLRLVTSDFIGNVPGR